MDEGRRISVWSLGFRVEGLTRRGFRGSLTASTARFFKGWGLGASVYDVGIPLLENLWKLVTLRTEFRTQPDQFPYKSWTLA